MQSIGIIGAGRAGSSLALSLSNSGCSISFLVDPAAPSPPVRIPLLTCLADVSQSVDTILICIPDRDIAKVLEQLTRHPLLKKVTALHLSGASNLVPFHTLPATTFRGIGMLHPLYSFPATATVLPPDLLYGVNGDTCGLAAIRELVGSLQGRTVLIKEKRAALYHALAVMTSNFPQALALYVGDLATRVTDGDEELELLQAGLTSLMLQSIEKLQLAEPSGELTGPARRGDALTLQTHLEELAEQGNNLVDLYRLFSQIILHRYESEIPETARHDCRKVLEEYNRR